MQAHDERLHFNGSTGQETQLGDYDQAEQEYVSPSYERLQLVSLTLDEGNSGSDSGSQ